MAISPYELIWDRSSLIVLVMKSISSASVGNCFAWMAPPRSFASISFGIRREACAIIVFEVFTILERHRRLTVSGKTALVDSEDARLMMLLTSVPLNWYMA